MTHEHAAAMPQDRLENIVSFLQAIEKLKTTLRSGNTSDGRRESTSDHTWRLCMMVLLLEKELVDIDHLKLLKICLVHDLGEAISGDVPAIDQGPDDGREMRERADLQHLCTLLPEDLGASILALWDEYTAGDTPEAALAKGLDKIETILQHVAGDNHANFDYEFNLRYGRKATDRLPLLQQLRAIADKGTLSQMDDRPSDLS